jgi:hypothetical protein
VSEYRHLSKVFWREQQEGFVLPDHRVVEDSNENIWLQVEHVDGILAQRVVSPGNNRETIDDFLSSYTSVLEHVIDSPAELFPSDIGLKQFMYGEDTWYLVDLEPRVDYFKNSCSYHKANETFIKSVKRVHAECERFRDYEKPLSETEEALHDVVEKTLPHDELFGAYSAYHSLRNDW